MHDTHGLDLEPHPRLCVLEDYQAATPRWCPGCGDHGVLGALQRLMRDEQMMPEETVVVSGIGCSSRLPHYMKTYGFHGLHGRPLPIASGVRCRRPDLNVFVVTGDGDCCAIGTAHWIHALRYNMKMTVLLLDNRIYGLTKMQTSPTSPKGQGSNTHPDGSMLSALMPLPVTLGVSNVSFVAQTIDWHAPHLYATLKAAHHHPGLAFVRIMQRCPHYMPKVFEGLQDDPSRVLMLHHPDGIQVDANAVRGFRSRQEHDPVDIDEARRIASRDDVAPIGLLYRNLRAERYDVAAAAGYELTDQERLDLVQNEIDRFMV